MNGTQAERVPSHVRTIPSRRVVVHDPSHLPVDYSTTPGGTIFSTTPGGTRIIYERKFLLELRNSPLSKTPPRNLPLIPGVTCDEHTKPPGGAEPTPATSPPKESPNATSDNDHEEPQFEMDI